MQQNEVVKAITDKTGLKKADVVAVLEAHQEVLRAALVGNGKITHKGFGTFSTTVRQARIGRNPQTGAMLQIAESRVVKFSPSKELKEALNTK